MKLFTKILAEKRLQRIVAFLAVFPLSIIRFFNVNGFTELGFPFVWMKYFHQNKVVSFLDLLDINRYVIRLDVYLIDVLLIYLVIRFILFLLSKFKAVPKPAQF